MRIYLLLIIPLLAFAQNATVYDLMPAETSDGRRLYREMKAADAAYHAWEDKLKHKYSNVDGSCVGMLVQACGADLEFTDDFKHAVPKAPPESQRMRPQLGVAW